MIRFILELARRYFKEATVALERQIKSWPVYLQKASSVVHMRLLDSPDIISFSLL